MSATAIDPATAVDVVRKFLDAFNETDAVRRRSIIEAVLTPDCSYTDPEISATGHEAFDEAIAVLQARMPTGARFSLRAPVDAHHQQARFAWQFGIAGVSTPLATGTDVAVFADGRIHQLYGFFDPEPVAAAG